MSSSLRPIHGRSSSPFPLVLLIALIVPLLAFVACGDDDDDAGDDSGNGGAPSAAISATATPAGAGATSVATEPSGDDEDDEDDEDDVSGEGPCSLLTEDEVAEAAGDDVLEAEPFSDGGLVGNCNWNIAPEDSFKAISLTNYGDEVDRSDFGFPEGAEEVDGVGDYAHWDPSLSSLIVQDGDVFFAIQILTDSGDLDADRETAKSLALKVIDRLD